MIGYEDWPYLPDGVSKIIYVDKALEWSINNNLIKKGYMIVDVRLMPNESADNKKEVIQACLLGIIDGTIVADDEKRKYLELLAKTEGLLVSKSISGKFNLTYDSETLHELLNFGDSRHTLRPASEKEMDQAKLTSIAPGGAEEDDKIRENPQ